MEDKVELKEGESRKVVSRSWEEWMPGMECTGWTGSEMPSDRKYIFHSFAL